MITVRRLKGIVYIVYTHMYTRATFSTGVKVEAQHWRRNRLSISCPDYVYATDAIEQKRSRVNNAVKTILARGMEPYASLVKQEMEGTSAGIPFDFFDDYDRFLAVKDTLRTDAYVKVLRLSRGYLEKFERHSGNRLDQYTINGVVFDQYLMYLMNVRGLSDQTVLTHVKIFKRFLRWAYPVSSYPFVKYKVTEVEDIIYLYESELYELMGAPLQPFSYLDKTRDLFVFCCVTGMRHSDSQMCSDDWISEGVFDFRQQKTGGRATPPVFRAAETILEKWEGTPKISTQKYNEYLKVLFQKLELNRPVIITSYKGGQMTKTTRLLSEIVTSHVARKTFIMMCLLKEIPIQDIMFMSGHSEYHSIRPYITVSKKHIRKMSRKWDI